MLTPKLAAVGPGTCGVRRTDHDWHPTSWTEATVLVPGEAKDDPTAPMQVRNAAGFTCARCLCYVDAAELYDDAPTMRDPAESPASLAPEIQPHLDRLETLRQFLRERGALDGDTGLVLSRSDLVKVLLEEGLERRGLGKAA